MAQIYTYWRRERRVHGIRNHVLVLPTTLCVNRVAELIWEEYKDVRWGESGENRVVVIRHNSGCCHVGFDREVAFRTLLGIASHPNVYGVVLVSLGCGQFCKQPLKPGQSKRENLQVFRLYDRLVKRGVKVYWVNVQEPILLREYSDSLEQAIGLGRKFVGRLIEEAEKDRRVEAKMSKIVVGVGNGASDPSSGLFANPAIGHLTDYIISLGGTVVFSQTTEVLGAEEYLFRKLEEGSEAYNKMARLLESAIILKEALREYLQESDPTPGNIASGISTLTEKSIGTILKIGFSENIKIRNVLPYAYRIPRNGGLYFMDTPGEDVLAITGMVAGGAHIVLFATGLGATAGSPVSPVVKVTANEDTYKRMRSFIDLYVPPEKVLEEGITIRDLVLRDMYPYLLDVINGRELSRSERLQQSDFDIRSFWTRA